jgi:hypothetical protein
MNPIRRVRRLAAVLAGLACAWLGLAAAAPAAFATPRTIPHPIPVPGGPAVPIITPPPLAPGTTKHPPLPVQVHTVMVSGMPGWQIALIAIGAALLAACAAVLADRTWAARRKTITAAA